MNKGIIKINNLKILYATKDILRKIKLSFMAMPRDFVNIVKYGLGAPRHSQIFYLDPREIRLAMSTDKWHRRDSGRVVDGDDEWDLHVKDVGDIEKMKMIKMRLLDGKSWEEAGAYKIMEARLKKYTRYDGCKSLDDVFIRYKKLDKMIEDIRSGGAFVKRSEINKCNFRESDGVYVHIGRGGEYIFGLGGCHRLAIAQALGVKKIPVQIGVVHRTAIEKGLWRKISRGPGVDGQYRLHPEVCRPDDLSPN